MAAGLPGTGIGGLFYVLSAFFMIVAEIHQTIRGRSSVARWRMVGRHVGVAAAMVAAVTAAIWVLHRLLFRTDTNAVGTSSTPSDVTDQLVPFSPVLITLAVLIAVLVAAYLAKFVFRRHSTTGVGQTADRGLVGAPQQPASLTTAERLLASGSPSKQ